MATHEPQVLRAAETTHGFLPTRNPETRPFPSVMVPPPRPLFILERGRRKLGDGVSRRVWQGQKGRGLWPSVPLDPRGKKEPHDSARMHGVNSRFQMLLQDAESWV